MIAFVFVLEYDDFLPDQLGLTAKTECFAG